jgi:hypothetical protein
MVKETKVYVIENDHRLAEWCAEHDTMPNSIPSDKFMEIANEIGYVMSCADFEMHHNTRTLPQFYYIRILENIDASPEGII